MRTARPRRRYFPERRDLDELHARESENLEIARKLYELRTKARLSQRELAKRVGTTASAICRLEDAGYVISKNPDIEGQVLFTIECCGVALNRVRLGRSAARPG